MKATNRHRGMVAAEAAIVFPLLLLLLVGIIHYGWMFLKTQQIANAARQAARIAVSVDATADEVDDRIEFLMGAAGMPTYTRLVQPVTLPDGRLGIVVYIEVESTEVVLINAPLLFPTPTHLKGAATMAKEGA